MTECIATCVSECLDWFLKPWPETKARRRKLSPSRRRSRGNGRRHPLRSIQRPGDGRQSLKAARRDPPGGTTMSTGAIGSRVAKAGLRPLIDIPGWSLLPDIFNFKQSQDGLWAKAHGIRVECLLALCTPRIPGVLASALHVLQPSAASPP